MVAMGDEGGGATTGRFTAFGDSLCLVVLPVPELPPLPPGFLIL